MKALLVAVAVAIVAGHLPAQTNLESFHTNQIVTITNKEGKIFKDIKIVSIKPNAVTYVPFDGLGGGIINFKTLSNTDQKRFAYNQAKADEADSEAVTKQAAEATPPACFPNRSVAERKGNHVAGAIGWPRQR